MYYSEYEEYHRTYTTTVNMNNTDLSFNIHDIQGHVGCRGSNKYTEIGEVTDFNDDSDILISKKNKKSNNSNIKFNLNLFFNNLYVIIFICVIITFYSIYNCCFKTKKQKQQIIFENDYQYGTFSLP